MLLMLHKQERGRRKHVTTIHVKDPSKDTAKSKIAQGTWQSRREFEQFFFLPTLRVVYSLFTDKFDMDIYMLKAQF